MLCGAPGWVQGKPKTGGDVAPVGFCWAPGSSGGVIKCDVGLRVVRGGLGCSNSGRSAQLLVIWRELTAHRVGFSDLTVESCGNRNYLQTDRLEKVRKRLEGGAEAFGHLLVAMHGDEVDAIEHP